MRVQDIKNKFLVLLIVIIIPVIIYSCGKKEEPQTFIPPDQESTVDKEKERLEREEFERLKRLQNGEIDSSIVSDSVAAADSLKALKDENKKKNLVQKEKELNKRLDNPSTAITDYLEYLKRGTQEGGNFELNMKKASQQWTSSNIDRFKSNYKNTTKIVVLEEPKIISQKGNEATVEVRIKKTDKVDGANNELDMIVKYNLVADSKGKWKIKDNSVVKK
ncbi:MAG TPA: hypothetical protein PKC58_06405 [Ignavibacteria bacterium]|nr:hypothetical protein [Ignavibacteria bacterium]